MYLTTSLIHALPVAERRVLSSNEAASYAGVSRGKFNKLVADGTLPGPLPMSGVRRWDRAALDRALDRLSGLGSGIPDVTAPVVPNEWDEVLVDG